MSLGRLLGDLVGLLSKPNGGDAVDALIRHH